MRLDVSSQLCRILYRGSVKVLLITVIINDGRLRGFFVQKGMMNNVLF